MEACDSPSNDDVNSHLAHLEKMADIEKDNEESCNDRVKGLWSAKEDEALVKSVSLYGTQNWRAVSKNVPGRTSKSCRLRWCNQLNPAILRTPFSKSDEEVIMKGYSQFGSRWSAIARLLPGRTDNAVKNHWNVMARRSQRENSKVRDEMSLQETLDNVVMAENEELGIYYSPRLASQAARLQGMQDAALLVPNASSANFREQEVPWAVSTDVDGGWEQPGIAHSPAVSTPLSTEQRIESPVLKNQFEIWAIQNLQAGQVEAAGKGFRSEYSQHRQQAIQSGSATSAKLNRPALMLDMNELCSMGESQKDSFNPSPSYTPTPTSAMINSPLSSHPAGRHFASNQVSPPVRSGKEFGVTDVVQSVLTQMVDEEMQKLQRAAVMAQALHAVKENLESSPRVDGYSDFLGPSKRQ